MVSYRQVTSLLQMVGFLTQYRALENLHTAFMDSEILLHEEYISMGEHFKMLMDI